MIINLKSIPTHFAINTLKHHTHFQIHLKFTSNRLTISIIIMKFALAFVLLIGISCQIGQGDCAPDGMYESLSGMFGGVYSLTQSAYYSIKGHLSPLTEYLPSPPGSLTSELSNMEKSAEDVESKAGDMLNSSLDSAEDLGSDTGDLMKSGMGKINDAVYD
ncbi:Uncharacterized protein FWK35_00015501 [Aphis craccivora]|uniref:Uncharacterized protein n=1 Tax=Aphis craccivora TaxID=307492 RepID=A0A6G0YLE5_APHCR|nr:Uncharacterized protein FWK35_00015501 [Aphis craccivora]